MKSWPARALLLAGAAALLASIPALGQDAPELLLPPGFGDPQNLPPPAEKTPAAPRAQPGTPSATPAVDGDPASNLLGDVEEVELDKSAIPRPANYFTIPEGADASDRSGRTARARQFRPRPRRLRPRPRRLLGIADARARRAFAVALDLDPAAPGAAVAGLGAGRHRRGRLGRRARRLAAAHGRGRCGADAGSGGRRRALHAADDRGGGADRARHRRSRRLCPLVAPARSWSDDPVWILADGMCAALEGEAARASALIDQARNQAGTGIDLLLAEKVVGSGEQSRRAVDIDWDGVDAIDPWRFGLASATGVPISRPPAERCRPAHPRLAGARPDAAPGAAPVGRLGGGDARRLLVAFAGRAAQPDARPARRRRFGRHGRRPAPHRLGRARRRRPDGGAARPVDGRGGPARALCAADPHRRRRRADSGRPPTSPPTPATSSPRC